MRPLRLEVSGLTSYRQGIEVDFTDLDLFAIWGPTGAGKSSLVDAMTFALFGQVPRMKGAAIKELISQGEDKMRVTLEFSADGVRYRVHRGTAHKGAAPVQLDRLAPGDIEWEPVADRATTVTDEIEKVLRMDYGAFVRSVLLPQGEFDRFLSGDRDERRKIIDGLLRLGVYAEMYRRANAMDVDATHDANALKDRLETELSDATPEALKAAKATLKDLEARAKELKEIREKAALAEKTVRKLSEATERGRTARAAFDEARKGLEAASKLLATGEATLKDFGTRIAALEAEARAANYDQAAHLNLTRCLPLLREIDSLTAREKSLADEIASSSKSLAKLKTDVETAAAKYEATKLDSAARRDAFTQAQRDNAASYLVQDLKVGDPCPICGQAVGEIKHAVHKDFSRLKTASEAAQEAEARAQAAVNAAHQHVALKGQQSAADEKQLATIRDDLSARQSELAKLLPEPGLTAKDVDTRIAALEAAKTRIDLLADDDRRLRAERQTAADDLAGAQTNALRLTAEATTHETNSAQAAQDASAATAQLAEVAKALVWIDVVSALDASRDPTPLIDRRLGDHRDEEGSVQRDIGGQKARIEQIEKDIAKAAELRAQEKTLRETATLAKDLASLLRTNNFPTFIREQALRALAEDGTRRLNEISRGRFDFEVDGQDFYVLDRWNGGERRSVKTLSGGETFLASLALALALAEQLPGLSGDTTGGALESLFIDEGFSHLDNETLDDVASALEILGQDRKRLVGVITHLPALAERMPARITVHKAQSGSTITID